MQKATPNLSLEKIKEVGKEIYQINQLVQFPISDEMIKDWTKSIHELAPELDGTKLKYIIDKFKTGELEYDSRKGIQNIFLAYIKLLSDTIQDYQALQVKHNGRLPEGQYDAWQNEIDRLSKLKKRFLPKDNYSWI